MVLPLNIPCLATSSFRVKSPPAVFTFCLRVHTDQLLGFGDVLMWSHFAETKSYLLHENFLLT